METVTTERLIIRRPAETDLHDFLSYQTHPENRRYQSVEPKTEAEAADFLQKQATLEIGDEGVWKAFAVELRSTGRLIGEVGVYLQPQPKSGAARQGDIGWALHPDFHGHGYATEAAHVLLAYVFEEQHLHRITSGCDARNAPSFRLMERLGMRREAHLRQSTFADGAWQDAYLYALLRNEWLAREER